MSACVSSTVVQVVFCGMLFFLFRFVCVREDNEQAVWSAEKGKSLGHGLTVSKEGSDILGYHVVLIDELGQGQMKGSLSKTLKERLRNPWEGEDVVRRTAGEVEQQSWEG